MLNHSTLTFLKELKKNNNREWFADNKAKYEQARANIEEVTAELIEGINSFDTSIGHPEAKKCLFRIYRDTRFAANKEPYKTNMGAILNVDGVARSLKSGYYMHIEPNNCFLSCGVYMSPPEVLKAIRASIYEDFDGFSEVINEKSFKKTFGELARDADALQRVPTGFDKLHPSAEYLKLKHFYVFTPVSDKEICDAKFVAQAVKVFKTSQPLKEWLNRIIDEI